MKTLDKKIIGERIRTIRTGLGMTGEQFGEMLGTSKSSVANWESGKNLPNHDRLNMIAFKASIDIVQLLTDENLSLQDISKHLSLKKTYRYSRSLYFENKENLSSFPTTISNGLQALPNNDRIELIREIIKTLTPDEWSIVLEELSNKLKEK